MEGSRPVLLWVSVAAAVVVLAGAVLTVVLTGGRTAGEPVARKPADVVETCPVPEGSELVAAYFDGPSADDDMRAAADRLRNDANVEAIKTVTRDHAYAEFLVIFKDQPELIDLARPEALPSSVQVKPANGVSPGQLAEHLRAVFPAAEVQSIGCRNPVPTS